MLKSLQLHGTPCQPREEADVQRRKQTCLIAGAAAALNIPVAILFAVLTTFTLQNSALGVHKKMNETRGKVFCTKTTACKEGVEMKHGKKCRDASTGED